jgi:hypothetical protein
MILTHESGAQEDQFDGKKEGQKSRGTIPLILFFTILFSRQIRSISLHPVFKS